ncbi:ATP-dependent helicase [Agrobacterium phage OLIVR6]|nr:ATP-dependent helicase [Agrobacterium phage OLIVR6]
MTKKHHYGMEIDEQLILELFPFDKPRDIQLEAIKKSLHEFNEGVEHVILDGPTGAGKSAIAYTIARYIQHTTYGEEKSLFTTITKYLQDQYIRDFPDLHSIRGAADPIYTCDDLHNRNTEGCVLHVKATAKKCMGECPYRRAQQKFMKGPLSLTNTHFVARIPRSWHFLVLDECHEVGSVITSAAETPIFHEDEVKFNLLFGPGSSQLVEIWRGVRENLSQYEHGEVFEMPVFDGLHEFDLEKAKKEVEGMAGQTGYRSLAGHLAGLTSAMSACWIMEGKEAIAHRDPKEMEKDPKLKPMIKPVYAADFADKLIFSKGEKILHMSATVCGDDAYSRELGFNDHNWASVSVRHPIPADTRKVYFNPLGWMSAKTEEKDFHNTAKFVDALGEKYDANMMIHTASYKRANRINDLSYAHIDLPKSAKEAIQILQDGANSKKKKIVASPSIMAGVDGKDDLCRINVIAKLPFPSFGDPRVRYISQKRPYLITQQVVRHVVQAAGRGTRHENDFSYTFILDGMFDKLYNDNKQMFPEWFKESIQWRYNGVLQNLPEGLELNRKEN